jgi:hypothetical protein
LSAFVIPAFIVIQKQKRDRKLLEKFLHSLETENNIKVTDHETWSNKILGIDYANQKALFVIRDKTNNEIQIIDLKHVSACTVEKSVVTSEFDKSVQAVSAIRLRFRGRDKAHPDQVFTVYTEDIDMTLGAELRIAEAWAAKFSKGLRRIQDAA